MVRYIKIWQKSFGNFSDEEIVSYLKTLLPITYHYLFVYYKTFTECLGELRKRYTCEVLHTEKLRDMIRIMPKSCNLKGEVILQSYMRIVAKLLEIDDTAEMKASEVNIFFAKLSSEYTI